MGKTVETDEYGITKIRITIDMELKNKDFKNLDYNLVWAYRKFSEIIKGNITGGKVEEL